MNTEDFLIEILAPVHAFCRSLDAHPPAYSYIPLRSDAERIRVMQSRLFNELRAADLFGTWLKTTPELDVKATMAESAHEEMVHAQLLSKRIRDLGAEPFDYKPLPAQIAMFNAMLADPTAKARFTELGASLLPGSSADFGKLIADETEKWARVVKFAGLKP